MRFNCAPAVSGSCKPTSKGCKAIELVAEIVPVSFLSISLFCLFFTPKRKKNYMNKRSLDAHIFYHLSCKTGTAGVT